MKKFLALLLLMPFAVSEELDVNGYIAGKDQYQYNCSSYVKKSDYGDYVCLKRISVSDVIIFHSDPYTKLVGKVFRYMLIEKSDLEVFKEKLIQKYGEPDVKAYKGVKERFGWGNVILESAGGFGLSFNNGPKKNGESIRVTFSECNDTWLSITDCPGLFETENPNKLIANIYMFNDEAYVLNFNSLVKNRDVRIPLEYPDALTENMNDLDL